MTNTYRAIVAGHICLDVIPLLPSLGEARFEKMFTPGRLIEAGPVAFSTGGPVSNTGLNLNRLGIKTGLMGKVGDDAFGEIVRRIVSAYGPDLADGLVIDPKVHTSYTVVINPPEVDRIFLHHPGANDTFLADDVRYDQVAGVDLFHFGYPPIMKSMYADDGQQLTEVFRRARATGVTTSLDMALPDPATASGQANWPVILKSTLPYVDIFLPSAEEILYTLRRGTYDELVGRGGDILQYCTPELVSSLARELLEMGVKVACIKLGKQGIYVRTAGREAMAAMGRARPADPAGWAGRELWAPTFQVEEVGTTGSGDATIAGFLASLLRGQPLADTLTAAVAVGACNVEAADALSGVQSWEKTMARIAAGWPRRSLTLPAPGWFFDEQRQLWVGPAQ